MAHQPLVLIAGQIQQLPNGDTLNVSATKFPMVCDTIDSGETVAIPATYQLIVAQKLNNSGTLTNDGRLVIL